MTFTYNGYTFESRQSEAQNIVWLEGNPDDSEAMPRSFDREAVAEHFLINRDMPEHYKEETEEAITADDQISVIETWLEYVKNESKLERLSMSELIEIDNIYRIARS